VFLLGWGGGGGGGGVSQEYDRLIVLFFTSYHTLCFQLSEVFNFFCFSLKFGS